MSCWSAEHVLDRGQDTHGRLHDGVAATLDFCHYNGHQEAFYSTPDVTALSAEAIVVAESLSESLKLHFSPFRPNISSLTAHENAPGQPATDYDWVFMPEACAGPANRSHAPPPLCLI